MSSTTIRSRPLLGLRERPGRLALAVMRLPRPLYHHGLGRLLGHTFLLITHLGRTTRLPRQTVAMALDWNPATKEAVVCSVWGETEWIRNLRAHPALSIQIGANTFVPRQRFLTVDEAVAAVAAFRDRHPARFSVFSRFLGWDTLGTEAALREFVTNKPFVAFQRDARSGNPTEPNVGSAA